jgi:hypothetical protein
LYKALSSRVRGSPDIGEVEKGMGGIIHLIMEQSEDIGTKGNLGLTAGMNARETLGTNFNLNHRKNKFSFFADYSILYDHNVHVLENHFSIHHPDFHSSFHCVKGIFSDFANDVEVLYTQNGFTLRNEELSGLAYLEEDVLAVYMAAEWMINESSQVNEIFQNGTLEYGTIIQLAI